MELIERRKIRPVTVEYLHKGMQGWIRSLVAVQDKTASVGYSVYTTGNPHEVYLDVWATRRAIRQMTPFTMLDLVLFLAAGKERREQT